MKIDHAKRKNKIMALRPFLIFLSFLFLWGLHAGARQVSTEIKKVKRPLTVQDMMKFKSINDPVISEDGKWLAFNAQPDRGNGEVIVYGLAGEPVAFEHIPRGKKPVISKDSRWIAAVIEQEAAAAEKETDAKKDAKKNGNNGKTGAALLDTVTGKLLTFENVKTFQFSDDSRWLVCLCYPPKKDEDNAEPGETVKEAVKETDRKKEPKKEDEWEKRALTLSLRYLPTGKEVHVTRVIYWSLDPSGRFLAYATYRVNGDDNGLFVRDLKTPEAVEKTIFAESEAVFTNLAWSKTRSRLAYIFHRKKKEGETGQDKDIFASGLWVWDGEKNAHHSAVPKERIPRGWMIPAENRLKWSEDGEQLFFGFKPIDEYLMTLAEPKEDVKTGEEDAALYDVDRVLEKRSVDVWHWNDPRIIPHQKKEWENFRKQVYYAVYHFRLKQFIMLADKIMPDMDIPANSEVALGFSDIPYLRDLTWDGRYRDVYLTYLSTGFRRKILTRHQDDVILSPMGRYAVYFSEGHWYLYDNRLKFARRLTGGIETSFSDEDHDYPSSPPSYGIAGWTENDRSVIIYDKFDAWEFLTGSNENKYTCLTGGEGRRNKLLFRIVKTDPEATFFKKNEKFLLTAYSDEEKFTAFYRLLPGKGVEKLLEERKRFKFLAKAKNTDRVIYTRESFEEFPDIWVSDLEFKSPVRVTDVNPQMGDFLWGTSELVEWKALDGRRLQGVVIKPENFDPAKRYPVLVYFYRLYSDRLYEFNEVVVNHRPCFPFYAGDGYIVFLPDVRFEVGHPGSSAFQCIVSGVQKLVEMGIADPKRVGLHGHSWGGYQTAYIITQTGMFAAAAAGAPVVNMTSAYSGIRWGSGLSRQFQYEKSQSRIGKSLWEGPDLYVENSPVFYADRVETPVLIEFGDEDGAVPWYQGIEFYLALRRLDKKCIFLQYNGEPHHLKGYANKLDYTIKMKEFFDHYLKGKPAPDWMEKGVPFKKKD